MASAPGAFTAAGGLARSLPGYAPRTVQQQMAAAVEGAIASGGKLIVEAGTGTGKTLAYLIPALASGRRVIVSTATRHLQEQILANDLPRASAALGLRPKVALLKGRANYLCRQRLEATEAAGELRAPQLVARLRAVREWSARTRSGDLGEVGDIDDGSPLWPRVSSTIDNCLGSDCPEYGDCWVVAARRAAQAAEIVIVNHHLLFADLSLREQGFGELLPGASAVILDEAHRLPDIAGQFFGMALSSRQLRDLVRDARLEARGLGGDMPDVTVALQELADAEAAFDGALGDPGASTAWAALPHLQDPAAALGAALQALTQALAAVAERAETLAAVGHRAAGLAEGCAALLQDDETRVRWMERRGKGWIWHATPLDVAAPFTRALARHDGAWIFTSATLAVNEKLDYFAERLGLAEADKLVLDSPFDYQANSLLYVPPALPPPGDPQFNAAFAEATLELIEASGGGAFVLCTSYRGLNACAARLRAAGVAPLLVQGEAGRAELLDAFRAREDAVLVGTGSFWEGVDVRGAALRLVIIDRLPFASPGDPVLAARIDAMRARGDNAFMDYQVPQAVIALKQGTGRLIRDVGDRGLLALCDRRVVDKPYGRVFLDSLPAIPLTRERERAHAFLRANRPAATPEP